MKARLFSLKINTTNDLRYIYENLTIFLIDKSTQLLSIKLVRIRNVTSEVNVSGFFVLFFEKRIYHYLVTWEQAMSSY